MHKQPKRHPAPTIRNDIPGVTPIQLALLTEGKARATPTLSAAFMYAAAHFNAYHAIAEGADRETQERAIVYRCDQYRKMLEENLRELRPPQARLRTDDF